MRFTCIFNSSCIYETALTTKISSNVNHIRLHPRTKIHTKILLYTFIHKIPPNSHHAHLHYYMSTYTVLYAPSIQPHKKKNSQYLQNYTGYIEFSNGMSGWSSASLDVTVGWGNKDTEWYNYDYEHPTNKAPGRSIIVPKRNFTPLLEG